MSKERLTDAGGTSRDAKRSGFTRSEQEVGKKLTRSEQDSTRAGPTVWEGPSPVPARPGSAEVDAGVDSTASQLVYLG